MSNIVTRKFDPEHDSGIIYSTWPKGFYYGGIEIGIKPSKEEWFSEYYKYIKDILSLPSTTVKIACIADDPSTIIGYLVMEDTDLHWIYVKELFRKQGIAKLLVKDVDISRTFNHTKCGQAILNKEKLDGRTEDRQENESL